MAASDLAKKGAFGRRFIKQQQARLAAVEEVVQERGFLLGTPPDQPLARCPLSLTTLSVLACARDCCSHLYRHEND